MDNKIWYTEEIFWYKEEKYKLCYIRKAPLHGRPNLIQGGNFRRKNKSYVTLGKLRYMDDQIWYREEKTGYVTLGKLCYVDDKIWYTEENFWYTEEKTIYVTLGKLSYMDSKIWYTDEIFWYMEEKYKLCYIRKALLHGGNFLTWTWTKSDTRRKIHGGNIHDVNFYMDTYTEETYKLCYIRKALFTWTDKIWYTEEIFWYTEEKYRLCYIRKALLHGDNIWYTEENFWYTEEKYKLCYSRKAPFKNKIWYTEENFWYTEEKYKLCYIRKALLHGRTQFDTRRKISDTRRQHTSYVTLGKLCSIDSKNLIHGGKFLIHGGKLQVVLH